MALLTPPPAAPQRGDRTTFANRVDAFITWLINFVSELVSLVANLNSIAAGGAYALPYAIQGSSETIGSIAGGKFFSNGSVLQIDTKDARGASIGGMLSYILGSSSTVKGAVRIVKQGDPSTWLVYNITGSFTQDAGGLFGQIPISLAEASGSFNAGDPVILYFQRTGDKGDQGSNGTSLTPIIWVRDEKPSGSNGPQPIAGYNVRTLNTVTRNTISGASLASNRVTLPAGTYRYWGSVPASGVGSHQGLIYNVTDNIGLVVGTNEYTSGGTSNRSTFCGDTTFSKTTVFELRHWAGSTSGSFGSAVGTGNNEVYSELFFEKIA